MACGVYAGSAAGSGGAGMSEKPLVEIWCDGAAVPNPGGGGIGVVLKFGDRIKELSEPIGHATNQAAEIQAATCALMALTRACRVIVHSDSQYLVKTMNGEYSRKTNLELWADLEFAAMKHDIDWVWLKGHNGDQWNERADRLAMKGVHQNRRGA